MMKMTVEKLTTLALVALPMGVLVAAPGDIISYNYAQSSDAGKGLAADTQSTLLGEIPVEGWSQITPHNQTMTSGIKAYTPSTGAVTEISGMSILTKADGAVNINIMAENQGDTMPDSTHAYMLTFLSRLNNGQDTQHVDIKGIPFPKYDLYVYFSGHKNIDNGTQRSFKVDGAATSTTVNAEGLPIAGEESARWGVKGNATPELGTNVVVFRNRYSPTFKLDGTVVGGGVAAIQIVEVEATTRDVSVTSGASISSVLSYPEDVLNVNVPADATLVIDAEVTRSLNIVSEGEIVLKGTSDHPLAATDLAKLFDKTAGLIYRIEEDCSAGTPLDFGAGTYSFKNGKISAQYEAAYKVVVNDGDVLKVVDRQGTADGRTYLSLDVRGGEVTLGKADGNGSFWYGGKNATTYSQTGGTVTCTANGTETSGSSSGLLLGWSSALAKMNVSGGIFDVSNSSLNFWSASTTINVSGDATVKAKGVFRGQGGGQINLSENAVFELGSIGWTSVPLALNGGTFKAYESTTMAGAITLNGAATVEVGDGLELTINNASGSGVLTKTGDGVIVLGTAARPTMNVAAGSVKIIASSDEIAAKQLVLPIPADAAPLADGKMSVVDEAGTEIMFTAEKVDNTIVVTLVSDIPVVTETTTISALSIAGDAAGLLIIQGAETEEEAITVDFDTELPAGVNVSVKGFVNLTGSIPFAKMTFENNSTVSVTSLPETLPTGVNLILQGNDDEANPTAFGAVTIPAGQTVKTKGHLSLTLTNNGTFSIVDGCAAVTASAQAIKGTINIAYGAVYKCDSNDQVPYGGSTTTTINVRGTLDMQNHRWTLGGADTINLYGGCTVLGQGDNAGLFDLYREGNIINVYAGEGEQATETTVTLPAPIRARNANGNIFIAQGMKLALAGGIKNADVSGATINMNGNGRLTGTVALKGGFYLNLGTSVGTIDAKFVAESGDTALKLGQSGASIQLTTADSKDEPIIWVKPGATLQLYVKDFSSWNQAVTEYGWIKNEGTLNFYENGGSRYFRGHLVMKPGTTTTIYGTAQNFIIYGGANDVSKAQVVVPASEEPAVATLAGEGTIQLNVNGSGGTAGSAWDIGANATLDVRTAIIGGETLVKYGAGQLKLTGNLSGYTGSINLQAGTIFVATGCNLSENAITTDLQGMKVTAKDVEGGKLYKVSPKSFTVSIQ